jgi:hypothetical protein
MANTPGTGNRRDPDMLSEPDPQLFDYEEGYHGRLFDAVFSVSLQPLLASPNSNGHEIGADVDRLKRHLSTR